MKKKLVFEWLVPAGVPPEIRPLDCSLCKTSRISVGGVHVYERGKKPDVDAHPRHVFVFLCAACALAIGVARSS